MNYKLHELMNQTYRTCRWLEGLYSVNLPFLEAPLEELLEIDLGAFLLRLVADTKKIYREDLQFLREYLNIKLSARGFWEFIEEKKLGERDLKETPFCSLAVVVRADNLHTKKTDEKPKSSAQVLSLFEKMGEAFLGNRPWVSESDFFKFHVRMDELRHYVKEHLVCKEGMDCYEKEKFLRSLLPRDSEWERVNEAYMDELDVRFLLMDIEWDD